MKYFPSPIFYYLAHRYSDLEAVKYNLFEMSLNQILLANGKDVNSLIDFNQAASQAMQIIDNVSMELDKHVAKKTGDID